MYHSYMHLQTSNNSDHSAANDLRKSINSDALFTGNNEIVIQHREQQYRLRLTRAGKLILTK
ncbi:MAG TPA: hemin uptake protein HemP [Nitrosomonas sp.]|nr:hemin uptake protein HemP [Nitrosomonas sp.]HMW19793.1 hemin uptake protein HemP [Nitrosomonas sp.]HMW68636.1 hemin uptake protein HemP [Nitrosomonas sp.]HMY62515.1 hemin uptake protein HemP [Nitrosomonas sp.]HMY90582.1 hemin uptake protein HemP [Nitrosomonas sp.]